MLIPSGMLGDMRNGTSLSRRVNANSQLYRMGPALFRKLIKKGEC